MELLTAAVAQLVVAPDCGSGCRGFESHQPPQLFRVRSGDRLRLYAYNGGKWIPPPY